MHATSLGANANLRPPLNLNCEVSVRFADPNADRSSETIYLIDCDFRVREGLFELLRSMQMKVISFGSAEEFLDFARPDGPGCLIIDMQMPDINGSELQQRIASETSLPIIFVSGHADVRASVRAMKAGAIEFFIKPVDPVALVEATRLAFAQDRKLRSKRAEMAKLQQRASLLTPREREVFPLVVAGLLNKQAACILGISEVTLQIHRRQVMRKMEAECFADLVRMALKLRIPHWRRPDHGSGPAVPISFGRWPAQLAC